jgi:hydroxyacylglutathione hydrolase
MEPISTQRGAEVSRLTLARCNIYVVSRPGKSIIVDTGIQSDRARIKKAIERRGIKPDAVILTHSHFDHAGNVAWLQKEYGAKVFVQASEKTALETGDMPIPEGTYGITKGIVSIGRKMTSMFSYERCIPDIVINEFMDLAMLGFEGYIMHIPGHSPGGVAIVIDGEIALAGDSVIGTMPGSPFPPFADDVDELMRSWKKLLHTGCHTFLPGHGKPISREQLVAEYDKRSLKHTPGNFNSSASL